MKFFLLGRLATKISQTTRVVSLGGGGIVGCEMQCGLRDQARWTVYALSRGRQEANPTLLDLAAQQAEVELVRHLDPDEAMAFASGVPAETPPPGWVLAAQQAQLSPLADPSLPAALGSEIFNTISVAELLDMELIPSNVVHITGFTDGIAAIEGARNQAVDKLANFSVLTWGGDHLQVKGFTVLVRDFLAGGAGKRVFAFRKANAPDRHSGFKQSWQALAEQYHGQFYIVEVDVEIEAGRFGAREEVQAGGPAAGLPGGAVKFFLLGRLATKITQTRRVVSLGGGGIVGCEMQCGLKDEARWTVYALNRGRREDNPTLLDVAACNPIVELVRNVDPNEAMAFVSGVPPERAPPAWVLGNVQPQMQQSDVAVRLADGRFECSNAQCRNPSWNGEINEYCSLACRPAPAAVLNKGLYLKDFQPGDKSYWPFPDGFETQMGCMQYINTKLVNAPGMHTVNINELCAAVVPAADQKQRDGISQTHPKLNHEMVLAGSFFLDGTFSNAYVSALRQCRGEDAQTLAGYSSWLWQAAMGLPPHQGTVWVCLRGQNAISMAQQKIADGMKLSWNMWSAASEFRDVPKKEVADLKDGEDGLLIRIDAGFAARQLAPLALAARAQGFLIIPNASFAVIKPYHLAPDRVGEIHLKEVKGIFNF